MFLLTEHGLKAHKDGSGLMDIGNKSLLKNGNFFMHKEENDSENPGNFNYS